MNIKWGKYGEFEGPYCYGALKYKLPKESNLDEKLLAVISATEGNFDSVNMYDKCIISVGIIQWCEAQFFGVSSMLSEFCISFGFQKVQQNMQEINNLLGYNSWQKQSTGKFCFVKKDNTPVKTIEEQRELFLGCSGKIGSWGESQKNKAILWAKTFVNILNIPEMLEFQKKYTIEKLKNVFLNKDVSKILFDNGKIKVDDSDDIIKAAYLSFLSFSANNPKFARNNFLKSHKENLENFKTRKWLVSILKEMTFSNKIIIYEDRYQKITVLLNNWYPNLKLPKNSIELLKESV